LFGYAKSDNPDLITYGVYGIANNGAGIYGLGGSIFPGVFGRQENSTGVMGVSGTFPQCGINPMFINIKSGICGWSYDPNNYAGYFSGAPYASRVMIEADTYNINELDQPSLIFSQDGGAVQGQMGFFNGNNIFTIKTPSIYSVALGTNDTNRLTINKDGELRMWGGAKCINGATWVNSSSMEYKKDITPISAQTYQNLLNKLDDIEIVQYLYKTEPEGSKPRIGVISENTPDELTSEDKKGIDTSKAIGYLLAVLKAQEQKIEMQGQKIVEMQEEISNLKRKRR
jgi:hypothetical protein